METVRCRQASRQNVILVCSTDDGELVDVAVDIFGKLASTTKKLLGGQAQTVDASRDHFESDSRNR